MYRIPLKSDQRGFTLIEMMAILVIIGTMASVTIKKYGVLEDTAALRGIQLGISELNARETLSWANHLFANGGFKDDDDNIVWARMDADLGRGYKWAPGDPSVDGGTIEFNGISATLKRTKSENTKAALWQIL